MMASNEAVYIKKCQRLFGMTQHLHVPWLLSSFCWKYHFLFCWGIKQIQQLHHGYFQSWMTDLSWGALFSALVLQLLESLEFNLHLLDTGASYLPINMRAWGSSHLVIQENLVSVPLALINWGCLKVRCPFFPHWTCFLNQKRAPHF